VRPDDRIMLGRPLQLTRVSHSAGYDRITIDRAAFHLAQQFLLRAQKYFPAGLGGLPVWLAHSGRLEQ
jgi:hypothetical protein